MKKNRIAGLLLLLPLTLLGACGGSSPTTLAISPNWYADTTTKTIAGTNEKLEYAVTFTPPTTQDSDYSVSYDDGVYETELYADSYTFADGTSATVYYYKTSLTISGRYTLNGVEGDTFEDYVYSEVCFYDADHQLLPIYSTKEIHSTNPVSSPSSEAVSDLVHFVYSVTYSTTQSYDAALESATITLDNKLTTEDDGENTQSAEIELDYSGTFLDNEQILFALRGLDMSASVSFSTINPQDNSVIGVTFSDQPTEVTITMDNLTINETVIGEDDASASISAYKLYFYYNASQSGTVRTAYYAAKKSSESNTYRNVLLRLEDPIANGYGTLVYTLKNATFTR